MKKLLALIFILVFFANLGYSQQYGWVNISSNIPGDSLFHDLSDLYFVSDNEGWITSSSHPEIYHTTDGGLSFEVQTTQLPCNAVWMLNENEGYCGGSSGFVYRTTDGGTTWPFIGTITNTLTDISFPPGVGTGYACGFNGAVWSITSGGVSNLNSGFGTSFAGISSPSVNNVWVCGGIHIYYYNGSFTEQFTPSGTFNAIYFINNQEGWVVGDQSIIAGTKDGGENWVDQANNSSGLSLFDVFFLNGNEGWAVGNNGVIMQTLNGSDFGFDTITSTGWSNVIWNQQAVGLSTAFFRRVHFTSPSNGYAVGNNKTLLKYTQLTGIREVEQTLAIKTYPNPTDGIIRLGIPDNQQVEFVVISDVMGKKILQKNNLFTNEISLQSLP